MMVSVSIIPALLATTLQVSAGDSVCYIGRVDLTAGAARSSWSATGVELKVSGEKLQATLASPGDNYVQVEVDGQPVVTWHVKGDGTFTISLPKTTRTGWHRVRLIKKTEPFVGVITWKEFRADRFARPDAPKRRLEIIGDSISCGYGNLGANQNEHFATDTEDAYQTYGSIAGRAVGAETWIHAWSGRKMALDNTIPEIYDLAIPTEPTTKWNFKEEAPQAILINLATNDFGKGNPDEKSWTAAYSAFIGKLRARAPKAFIYCATGSMMTDSYPPGNNALSTVKGYLNRMVARIADPRVKRIDFDPQRMEDGIGSDWHPNVKTHTKMAAVLTEALRKDLGW
jgi:hypothetical protein